MLNISCGVLGFHPKGLSLIVPFVIITHLGKPVSHAIRR